MPKINLITSRKINLKQMYIVCRQLSIMLSSGINVVYAFEMLKTQKNNKKTSKALGSVVKGIQSGESLCFSLKAAKCFPETFINMVMVGENSGNLDNVFIRLSDYYYNEYKIKQTIKQALAYPVFILVVTFIASIIISVTILPMICSMIEGLTLKSLPMPTRILMKINIMIESEIFLVLFMAISFGIFIIVYISRRYILKKVIFKIPLINSIYKRNATARFARSLSMLFTSGIPIIDSLRMCEVLLGNVYESHIKDIKVSVESGESLYSSIKKSSVFPEFFYNMIETGEESGKLDFVLNKIGEFYENEVEFSIKKATKIFEPSLIICLSVVVGLLLASVMLPLFQIYGEV